MSQIDAPFRAGSSVRDHREPSLGSIPEQTSPMPDYPELETRLGEIIRTARDVAACAEELLREITLRQQVLRSGRGLTAPLAVDEALLPLDETRQRLLSALEGLPLH